MVLAVLVALGTLVAWGIVLGRRARAGLPLTERICERAFFTAFEFGGAVTGAAFPTVWLIVANVQAGLTTGNLRFVIAGRLPPGVEEQDLLAVLFVGTVVLLIKGFFQYRSYLVERRPDQ